MILANKVIAVVGGSGLLGAEIAAECVRQGARVAVVDLKEGALPEGASFISCDAADETQLAAVAAGVKRDLGRIDGVVNATYPAATRASDNGVFAEGDLEAKLASVTAHLRICFALVRSFSPVLKEQGSGAFVFFSSIYGVAAPRFELYDGLPMTQPAEYAAAKAGILGITRYFASLLGKDGIRVNAISPGGIAANQPESFVAAYRKRLLIGDGLLLPRHISGAAAFLVSDASEMMTGQNLVIDGGWTL